MSRSTKVWLILISTFLVAYTVVRSLGMLTFYTLPSTSMEPNYMAGKMIVASNFAQTDLRAVVCYRATALPIEGMRPADEGIFIGRIVAGAGDELELKDGRVYLNGEFAEEGLNLKFLYELNEEQATNNRAQILELNPEDVITNPVGGMYLFLAEQEKRTYAGHEGFKQYDGPLRDDVDYPASAWVEEGWTVNNYGPITIPAGYYFIMGDNRHNSEDSRVRGFVPEEDVIGVVLN